MSRTIKSFVKRKGRISENKKNALLDGDNLMTLDFDFSILKKNELVLEIGFGTGSSLIKTAIDNPNIDYIGVEVYETGIANVLLFIEENKLENLKVFQGDVIDLLEKMPNNFLNKVQIFFPDPWPKKKHHKRRLVQPEFINLIVNKLKCKGLIHLATDWENYSEHMMEVLNACAKIKNLGEGFMESPYNRPLTKFEAKGIAKGHIIRDIVFYKL